MPASLEAHRSRYPRLVELRAPELFVNAEGTAMTRAGFEYVLDKHVRAAAGTCPTFAGRTVSPHQFRHSCAVIMLQATRDIRKVALWLGHADIRTTEVYLRMDPGEKLEAVEAAGRRDIR
jgi:site-specific recombinase XerD